MSRRFDSNQAVKKDFHTVKNHFSRDIMRFPPVPLSLAPRGLPAGGEISLMSTKETDSTRTVFFFAIFQTSPLVPCLP